MLIFLGLQSETGAPFHLLTLSNACDEAALFFDNA